MFDITIKVGQNPRSEVFRFDSQADRSDLEDFVRSADLRQKNFESEVEWKFFMSPLLFPYTLTQAFYWVGQSEQLIVEVPNPSFGLAEAYQKRKTVIGKVGLVLWNDGKYLTGIEIFNANVFFEKDSTDGKRTFYALKGKK